MNPPGPPVLFWVFMGVWCILGVGGSCFFRSGRDASLKRAVFPWFLIGADGLLALFVVLLTGQPWALEFVIPALAVLSLLSIRLTKFCQNCGAMLYNQAWFTPMRFCPKCGALQAPEKRGETSE